eukprot:scaffold4280_cov169-Ochromonas_danica.AAC.5
MILCPLGFDCALLNSCPSYIQPCPDGFFCGSYANSSHLDELDYRYAMLLSINSGDDVTQSNKEDFVPPGRVVQSMCFAGFYCPDHSSILVSLSPLLVPCMSLLTGSSALSLGQLVL